MIPQQLQLRRSTFVGSAVAKALELRLQAQAFRLLALGAVVGRKLPRGIVAGIASFPTESSRVDHQYFRLVSFELVLIVHAYVLKMAHEPLELGVV